MSSRTDAAVERADAAPVDARRDGHDPTSVRQGSSVTGAVAWTVWLISTMTVLGWIALALMPRSSGDAVFPWWFRVSGWVQVLTLVTVGRLIVSRYPRHLIGWSFSAAGVLLALHYGTRELLQLRTVPLLPLVEWLVGTRWLWIPAVMAMTVLVPLTFPDGRPPSRHWRVVVAASVVWISALTLARVFRPGPLLDARDRRNVLGLGGRLVAGIADHGLALWPIFLLAGLAALLARFRQLDQNDRARSQWLTVAMALMIACLAADKVVQSLSGSEPVALFYLSAGAQVLVPVIAAVAILKLRLYGIEVVVQRALVYAALAVLITGVYVAVVGGLGTALHDSGRPSDVLPLLATAVVATAFQPARERLQRLAAHVVYGRRSTPYEVLAHFVDAMPASIADAAFLEGTARVVAEGLGAVETEVWVRAGDGLRRVATYPRASSPDPGVIALGRLMAPDDGRVMDIRHGGDVIGALVVRKRPGDHFRAVEVELLDDVARQAGLVLANGRLATELAAGLEELKASRARIVSATDAERRRLERDLHDGAQQRLVNVALILGLLQSHAASNGGSHVGSLVQEANDELAAALSELRELARGIHPAILAEAGLGPAVRSLAQRSKTPTMVECALDRRLPELVEVAAYFLVAEAVTNAVKHAHATRVDVRLLDVGGELVIEIADDGVGGADPQLGSGLRGLIDRVGAVDGTVMVRSAPGCGTRLEARLPCE